MTPASYKKAFAITPHASNNFTQSCRGIHVGGAGTLTAIVDGNVVLFSGLTANTILPIEATRVNAIGTTATLLVGLS